MDELKYFSRKELQEIKKKAMKLHVSCNHGSLEGMLFADLAKAADSIDSMYARDGEPFTHQVNALITEANSLDWNKKS